MIAGATYTLPIDIQYPLGNVSKVIVTLKNETTQQKILKNYPNDNETYLMSDGRLGVRLSQQDTISLVGNVKVEAQINLASGAVAKTETKRVFVSPTLHTEMVSGAEDNGDVMLEDVTLEIGEANTLDVGEVDDTLTVEGAAADAKAVGDRFAAQQEQIEKKQPAGDYALKNEIPEIPVRSINGKTGAVQLTAADVGAASRETVEKLTETVDMKIGASELTNAVETALTEAKESGEFDGEDGRDGTSVTVSSVAESTEDGGSNVVRFSDGKTLTVKNGKTGADGKTPVKGADYFTADDKTEMVDLVLAEMPTWNGGSY